MCSERTLLPISSIQTSKSRKTYASKTVMLCMNHLARPSTHVCMCACASSCSFFWKRPWNTSIPMPFHANEAIIVIANQSSDDSLLCLYDETDIRCGYVCIINNSAQLHSIARNVVYLEPILVQQFSSISPGAMSNLVFFFFNSPGRCRRCDGTVRITSWNRSSGWLRQL